MPEKDIDDVLAHHGIKGQKWGVRRTQASLARAGEGIKRANELEPDKLYVSGKGRRTRVSSGEAARAQGLATVAKKHGASTLSNRDLEFLNKRIQLQATYTKLNPKQKSKVAQIIETVNQIDKKTGRLASNAVKGAVVKVVDKKTNGQASEIMKIVDQTAAKQRTKKKAAPQEVIIKEGQDPLLAVIKDGRPPKQVYDISSKTWKEVD